MVYYLFWNLKTELEKWEQWKLALGVKPMGIDKAYIQV